MFDLDGYDAVRFDTLGVLPVTSDGFIRFDKNCTPGRTVPCGNACRAPQNCKSKGKKRVSEAGSELRQRYADQIRSSKGLASKSEANKQKATAAKRYGKATMTEASLVDKYVSQQAKKKQKKPLPFGHDFTAAEYRSLDPDKNLTYGTISAGGGDIAWNNAANITNKTRRALNRRKPKTTYAYPGY